MVITGIIICCIALIVIALLNSEEPGEQAAKIIIMFVIILIILCLVYDLSYDLGVKDGAYNQLRGKYDVTYVIDKDSCIVDTIINLN